MSRSFIFKNRGKLSPRYVPRSLRHWEKQIHFLLNLYRDALEGLKKIIFCRVSLYGLFARAKA